MHVCARVCTCTVCVCVYVCAMMSSFGFFYYRDEQHDLRQVEEERLDLILQMTLNSARKTGQKLQQEPGGRNWSWAHRQISLTGSLAVACSPWFWIQPRTTCPVGSAHTGLGPPTASRKSLPENCLQANLMEAIFKLGFLSSQVTLLCVKPPNKWTTNKQWIKT